MRGEARLISSAIRKLAEDRTFDELERAAAIRARLEHFGAENIGGHEVGRELHAILVEAHHGRKRLDESRLSEARQTDQQRMPAAEHGRESKVHNLLLANETAGDRGLGLGELRL